MNHMNMLRERGTTILLVSHNATLMRDMCDTVGWLDHGRLMELGTRRSWSSPTSITWRLGATTPSPPATNAS